MWGLVLEDPHNLCGCYRGIGLAAPRLLIHSPGPHCHASLQGLSHLEVLPEGQVQVGTHRKGGQAWEGWLPPRGTHRPLGPGSTMGRAFLPVRLALPTRS